MVGNFRIPKGVSMRNADGTKRDPMLKRKAQRPLTKEQVKRAKQNSRLAKALARIFK